MRRISTLLLIAGLLAGVAVADDTLMEGVEKVDVKDPPARVTRPTKDWVFFNLEVVKKQELEKNPGNRSGIEDSFSRLKAHLLYGSASAHFFVFAWASDADEPDIEALGKGALEQTRGFLKEQGKVVAAGRTKHGKHEAYGFEVEGMPTSGADELSVSKLIVFRKEDKKIFQLSLEVPKKNLNLVKKDKAKLFSGVKL